MNIRIIALLIASIYITASLPVSAQPYDEREVLLKPLDYRLSINVDYEKEKLNANCVLTVKNRSEKETDHIPLLLYRLMKVTSISDAEGEPVRFKQQILSFVDDELKQVNYIEILPEDPLISDEVQQYKIDYEGYLRGFTETGSSYIKDSIKPEFTIIREDIYAYPQLGYPSWRTNRRAGFPEFTYKASITVPDSLTVANGGRLLNKSGKDGKVTFVYENIKPSWRMDFAISNYEIIEDNKIRIFHFPDEKQHSDRIMEYVQKSVSLYTGWFGPMHDYRGFSIIEIPEGFGSQTDKTAIIQTDAAFRDKNSLYELYHEVTHLWNVNDNDVYPPRWNEGLAVFLQYITVEELEGREILKSRTERFYNYLQGVFNENPHYKDVPMISYGKEDMTRLSYTVGMLFFQVLYNMTGADEFNQLYGSFYQKYKISGATADEFYSYLKENSSKDLTMLLNEWIYSRQYVDYIMGKIPIETITDKYLNSGHRN